MIGLELDLPFKCCSDEEFLCELEISNQSSIRKIPLIFETIHKLYLELPFHNLSDYSIMHECMTTKDKLLVNFENNSFSSECLKLTEGLNTDNFSCKYYNENNFPLLLKKYHTDDLKTFHLNIRSLNKHIFELKAYLTCLKTEFDVILLTEIAKTNTNLIQKVFPDFETFLDPATTKKGGAAILVRKNKFDLIEELPNECQVKNRCGCSVCIIESKFLKLTVNNSSIIIGCIYRHPNGNVTHFNDSLLNVINRINKKDTFIIGGDINIDLLKLYSKTTENYFNNLIENNFIPCISVPTRITERTVTLIDHIFIRLPKSKINSLTSSGCLISDISDHLPNFLILQLKAKSNKDRPLIRSYTKKNIAKYKSNISTELNQFILNELPDHDNIEHFYAQFFNFLNDLHEKYFPKVRLSRKKANDKIWITEGIKNSIKHKNKLFHLQLNNPTTENVNNWKKCRNQLNKLIKKAQIDYYKNLIDNQSTSCQGLWKTFGSIISQNKNKKSQIKQLKVNNKVIKSSSDIAETFNNFFCKIGSNLSAKFNSTPPNAYSKYMGNSANQSMFLFKTNATEVEKIISKLENKKSTGHDDISVKFIKISSTHISELLSQIINTSIKTGCYPDQLKIAKVIPIFKKGSNSDPNNYRPISILSNINKIFEKILHSRLYKYLDKFNLLYEYQFGFRKGHSTTQALIELTDNIKKRY